VLLIINEPLLTINTQERRFTVQELRRSGCFHESNPRYLEGLAGSCQAHDIRRNVNVFNCRLRLHKE
jgi:hypothetical protein